MNQVMAGALAMGFLVAGLFFFRFWRQSRDRLFALFGLSFVLMAVNRAIIGWNPWPENRDHFYWIRLATFAIILVAIADKNRKQRDLSRPRAPA